MLINQNYFLDYKHAKLQIVHKNRNKRNCFKLNSSKQRQKPSKDRREPKIMQKLNSNSRVNNIRVSSLINTRVSKEFILRSSLGIFKAFFKVFISHHLFMNSFEIKIRIIVGLRVMLHHPSPQELEAFEKLVKSDSQKSIKRLEISHNVLTLIRDLLLRQLNLLILLDDKHPLCPQLVKNVFQLGFSLTCLIHSSDQVLPQP